MKAYEAAKLLKISNKEFIEKYEVKSHLSKLSDELEAELFGEEKKIETARPERAEEPDTPEADVVESVEEECPVDLETLKTSLRGVGGKSPYWKWRHLVNG